MTSPANQQNIPAPNTTTATATGSYASAAGSFKKPQQPATVIATGSHPVVVGSPAAPAQQHAKASSVSPMNGSKPPMPAAVPAVVRGTSNINGSDHQRKSSVTISAPNSIQSANGGPVGGAPNKALPVFGFASDSPHNTPQQTASVPVPIPGNARIPSPSHSPSPIPQPSASGGRPPSTIQQDGSSMKFGSFGADGDRTMKQHISNMSQNSIASQAHGRRDSNQSAHNEMGGQAGQPSNRGGFQPQGGRGRGYSNNPGYAGFPPGAPYSRGTPGQGRGGMGPQFPPRGPMPPYNNSPRQPHASPAIPTVLPHQGTPQMQNAMPVPGPLANYPNQFHFHPPSHGFPPQNVNTPTFQESSVFKGKKKGPRRDAERFSQQTRNPDSSLKRLSQNDVNGRSRRLSKRWEATEDFKPSGRDPLAPVASEHTVYAEPHLPPHIAHTFPRFSGHLEDLSPASGNFDRLLTARKQNYPPYNPQFVDPMRGMVQSGGYPPTYNQVNQFMSPPSQSPSPGFAATYNGAQFNPPPPPQQMSRNPSQVSERPTSSMGQIQPPVIVQGGSAPVNASQAKPPAVVSSSFQKPKKSAIVIKNAAGETINFNALNKTPASPAASIQQSKTPPVIASTPTPPPKSSTPSHVRSESASTLKTAEQVRKEFQQQVRKTTETPAEQKAREEEAAKASAEGVSDGAAAKPDGQTTAHKEDEATSKVAEAASSGEEVKTTTDAQPSEKQEKPAEAVVEDEEDELERQIREMEEAEAKRDAEEAEYAAKKKVQDAAAKKLADEKRSAEAADNDRKLKEAEREMERLEEERERQRKENEGKAAPSVADLLSEKMEDLTVSDKKDSALSTPDAVTTKLSELQIGSTDVSAAPSPSEPTSGKPSSEKQRTKPSALNLAPLNTKAVEPPQPSAALQSLRTARFIQTHEKIEYPSGISSPNPALNLAVTKKGNFKYDPNFLLQFKNVFTEKPSVEFDQQLKTLMGDGDGSRSAVRTPAGAGSGRQNSRTAGSGFPAMGSMGSFGAKPLPPGTTSEQRFAMSSGGLARPNMAAIPSFSRPGGFPGPSQMSRSPSSSNMGNVPNSPRQGSRRTQSKRNDFNSKHEVQNNKSMPLTSGMELKPIAITSSGWKASSLTKGSAAPVVGQSGLLDPAMVQRKVKAALNKMTPEKFDKIADQILLIALQSKDEEDGRTLRQVIQLTFEKATDEAHWASMYAKFCKRMLEMMSPEIRDTTILDKAGNVVNGGALFRKYLLNRCQEEFERGWTVDLPKPKEGENKEAVMLSEEYYTAAAAKRRGLGLVQFIGELYKLGMLTERIMHECVRKLVDYQATPDEAEIESLSKLLRTIGHNLDNTEKGKPMMDAYFNRIQTIIDLPDLPSRLQFMLMDIMDLRRRNWVSNEANKGPKTLDEVRLEAEAAAAQKAAEAARSSQRGPPGGRPNMGRGDARQFSYNQPAPNQVGMDDLRRLKGSTARSAVSNVTLGPTSMFASRSNSGRTRLGPGGALGRAGEESGASSRTGTPPTRDASHTNAFSVLQNMETDNPASPPSVAASPALSKAVPVTSGAGGDKKESD